jgi:hypothetical protein
VTTKVEVVLLPAGGVTLAGETPQVTVGVTGETEQVKLTAELKLFNELTEIVVVVLFPADVAAEAGLAPRLKSLTASVSGTDRLCPPLVPVTVTV